MRGRSRLAAPDLDGRIAAAFGDHTNSAGVADLIAEAESAAVASGDAAERARTRALDPALSAGDLAVARREMEDAAFRRDRMGEAVRRLGERLREVKAQEEQSRRRAAYDAAVVERDALARELATVYPTLADKLADLAARVAASDAAIEHVNQRLPEGANWVAPVEMIARRLPGFNEGTATVPRIAQQMRLPAFRYSSHNPYTGPRS